MQEIFALRFQETLHPDRFARLLPSVDPERQDRINRFQRREDALRCLFGDLLVRAVLIRETGVRNRDLIFSREAGGKPVCLVPEGIHFNLSHSGSWILVAFDDRPVGADIEMIKPIDPGVAKLVLSPVEVEMMDSLPEIERLSFFFETWTLKESWLKASGCGLTDSLASYTVIPGDAPFRRRMQNGKALDDAFLTLLPSLDPDYRAAVCSGRDGTLPAVVYEDLEELAGFFSLDQS